jgi:RNA polymerase sigma-70 factor (ECF subfamily)
MGVLPVLSSLSLVHHLSILAMTIADTSATDTFAAVRGRLFAIAYRMLGTRADAEDVVQDVWLRWHGADHASLTSAEAWLVTVTTRAAIDRLRQRQIEREHYTGWWLPEPLVEADQHTPERAAELAGEVSMAMMWVLERLSAEERAAFLMRQVFEHDYSEIAAMLGKSEAACRQMVSRAQARVREERVRFQVSRDEHRAVLASFMQAASRGDRAAMKALLAGDAQLVADGGGKVRSFMKILCGAGRVAGVYWSVEHAYPGRVLYRQALVNGEPGLLRYVDGVLESAQSFVIDGGRILAAYIVRNPDKLAAISL